MEGPDQTCEKTEKKEAIEKNIIHINDILGNELKRPLTLDILELPINNFENGKCSSKQMGIIQAYGANTHEGLIRNYKVDIYRAGTAEARNYSAIKTNWSSTLVSLIRSTDDSEFDNTLAAYEQFLAENGWDDIEKVMTEKIQKNAEKLGL